MNIKEQTDKIKMALGETSGVIAFPTDTVWGLGCKIANLEAVKKIYEVKGRDSHKPLILLGSSKEVFKPYVANWTDKIDTLISKYMPGSLTLVVERSTLTPSYVTCGFDTVGIRIPNSPVLLDILANCVDEHVLATTSANISGEPACVSFGEVTQKLGDKLDYIVDYRESLPSGTASTVASIDFRGRIKVLRQGGTIISEDLM